MILHCTVEVLDFGCGDGRYLQQYVRSAEAPATCRDYSIMIIIIIISSSGSIIIGILVVL